MKLTHGSLFSGIGGFDLAAEWAGWENAFHCEWNEFGQKILKYYWPNAESYGDITKTDFSVWRGRIDVLTGGFPCQPYSLAGKRKGKEDERHLWPEMLRAIREIQPRWVVGENVFGLINWNGGLVFDEVQSDLEAEGYEVQPYVLPACAVNAPHRRDRVWFVAHAKSKQSKWMQPEQREFSEQEQRQLRGNCGNVGDRIAPDPCNEGLQGIKEYRSIGTIRTNGKKQFARLFPSNWRNFPTQSPVCNGNDGISSGLDGITFPKWRNESIKAGGNAIVPQVVYQIFKAINQYEYLQELQ